MGDTKKVNSLTKALIVETFEKNKNIFVSPIASFVNHCYATLCQEIHEALSPRSRARNHWSMTQCWRHGAFWEESRLIIDVNSTSSFA